MEPTSTGALKRRLRHGVDIRSRNPHTVLPLPLRSPTCPRKESKSFQMLWSLVVISLLTVVYWIFMLDYINAGMQSLTKKIDVPSSVKASVFIMNYGRPDVLKTSQLLPTLTSHENIDEIFLLHANYETRFDYKHKKVRNIDAVKENNEIGLSLRFHFCNDLSKNDWVFMIDDDMEFPPESLTFLLSEFMVDSKRIIGKWGRNLSNFFWWWSTAGYNTVNQDGYCEVVLTKFMLMEQSMCKEFRKYEHLVKNFVQHNSKPYWNGEDIFMSLVANHVYGYRMKTVNYYLYSKTEREYRNSAFPNILVDDVGRFDGIHGKPKNKEKGTTKIRHIHENYRGRLWKLAKEALNSAT